MAMTLVFFLRQTGRAVVWLMLLAPLLAAADSPAEILRVEVPILYRLYAAYPEHHGKLDEYAVRQNFRRPFERLGTAVHELIHIDSYAHQGYFIEGVYYEPYLKRSTWPALSNKDMLQFVKPEDLAGIYYSYVGNTPGNHLGNVVDEINAYGHVLPFICRHEVESAPTQSSNLLSFMKLQERYLQTLRERFPDEYRTLRTSIEARGVMGEVTLRARKALRACGVQEIAIPYQEMAYFTRQGAS